MNMWKTNKMKCYTKQSIQSSSINTTQTWPVNIYTQHGHRARMQSIQSPSAFKHNTNMGRECEAKRSIQSPSIFKHNTNTGWECEAKRSIQSPSIFKHNTNTGRECEAKQSIRSSSIFKHNKNMGRECRAKRNIRSPSIFKHKMLRTRMWSKAEKSTNWNQNRVKHVNRWNTNKLLSFPLRNTY